MCTARLSCGCRKRPAVSGMSRRMQALFALKLLCWVTKMWRLVTTTTTTTTTSTQIHCYSYYYYYRRRKLRGGGKGGISPSFIVFNLRIVCFDYGVEDGQINWGESGGKGVCVSSCLHRASIVSKTLLLFRLMHTVIKIIEMLKQFKIIILARTCFGSRRNHNEGAVLCLAKTTKWFYCTRRCRRSQCYGSISACCAGVRLTVETGTKCSEL